MAFYGCEFLFDGKSCKEYGLTLYNFGSVSQGDTSFPSAGKVYEEREVSLGETWEHAFRIAVTEDGESVKVPIGVDTPPGTILSFLVWGTQRECP